MKIKVRAEGVNLNLPIPTGLVLNRFTAALLPKVLEESGIHVTQAQAQRLVAAIRQFRRSHPDWVLVEVHAAKGEQVLVKL